MSYPILVKLLVERKITNESLSTLLGVHRNTITNKFNGGSFTVEEAIKIKNTYFSNIELEELFKKND